MIVVLPVVPVLVLLQRRFIDAMTGGGSHSMNSSCFNLLFLQIPLASQFTEPPRLRPVPRRTVKARSIDRRTALQS